jgi:UDP-N-acetylmuramate dehydrogenase
MVSLEHGNFIVNLGGAKAQDILALVRAIQEELPLELEWEVWP